MTEPHSVEYREPSACAEPTGSAANASVNMDALIPFILLAALFLAALFVMHEDAVASGRAAESADNMKAVVSDLRKHVDERENRTQQWDDYVYTNLKEVRAGMAAARMPLKSRDPGLPPQR